MHLVIQICGHLKQNYNHHYVIFETLIIQVDVDTVARSILNVLCTEVILVRNQSLSQLLVLCLFLTYLGINRMEIIKVI